VKHINLDTQDEHVKQFVLSLQLDTEGSVLEAGGKAIARVLPVNDNSGYDSERLKQAILNRRDESRALNEEWEHADREVWHRG
jgi:preprotein translocase subunit Sec63